MTKQEFAQWAERETILMDGATGSGLFAAGMPHDGSTELWMLENPDVVKKLQREYADAGSKIIYACTFSANRYSLNRFGLSDRTEELNVRLVELTKDAVGDLAYVAGDMTMTGEMLEPFGEMETDELLDIYHQQAEALVKGDVDLIGVETMLSLDELKVALKAIRDVCDLPVICTMTVTPTGKTIYGFDIIEAVQVLQENGASAVGINCSPGPDQLEDVVRRMKEVARIPIIAKPNAGLPTTDAEGNSVYEMDAAAFAGHMKRLIDAGARIVGGCCGTTPEYIRKLKEIIG